MGHLLDAADPLGLATISEKIGITISSNEGATCHPVYIIGCENKESTILFFIESLIDRGIMRQLPHDKGDLMEDIIKRSGDFEKYFLMLQESNPNVHLIRYDYDAKTNYFQGAASKYIQSNPILQRQLKNAYLIETISMKVNLEELDALPVLNTFIPEHGFAKFSDPMMQKLGFSEKDHGIFLKPESFSLQEKADILATIQQKDYLEELLSINRPILNPDQTKITDRTKLFLEDNLFVPGYMQDKNANNLLIQSIALSDIAKAYNSVVFHVNPKVLDKNLLNHELLAKHGYSQIEYHGPNKKEVIEISPEKKGKTIHIFSGYRLNDHDYDAIYRMAQIFAGASGDKTLEKVMSYSLIPVYETRSWKKVVTLALKEIANKTSGIKNIDNMTKYLHMLIKLEKNDNREIAGIKSKELATIISDKDFISDWSLLLDKVHKQYNFYDKLPDVILKGLLFYDLTKIVEPNMVKESEVGEAIINHLSKSDLKAIFSYLLFLPPLHHVAAYMYSKIGPFDFGYGSQNDDVNKALEYLAIKNGYLPKKSSIECEQKLGGLLKPIFEEAISTYLNQKNNVKGKKHILSYLSDLFFEDKDSKIAVQFLNKLKEAPTEVDALNHIISNISTLKKILPALEQEDLMSKVTASMGVLLFCNMLQVDNAEYRSEKGFARLASALEKIGVTISPRPIAKLE